jgi:hypothetical protein
MQSLRYLSGLRVNQDLTYSLFVDGMAYGSAKKGPPLSPRHNLGATGPGHETETGS